MYHKCAGKEPVEGVHAKQNMYAIHVDRSLASYKLVLTLSSCLQMWTKPVAHGRTRKQGKS